MGFIAGVVCNLAGDAYGCACLTNPMGVKVCVDVLDGMSVFPNHTYLHRKGSEAF